MRHKEKPNQDEKHAERHQTSNTAPYPCPGRSSIFRRSLWWIGRVSVGGRGVFRGGVGLRIDALRTGISLILCSV